MMNDIHDLEIMIKLGIPLLIIESVEELRVQEMLTRLAIKTTQPLFTWTVTDGLQRLGFGDDFSCDEITEPDTALKAIKKSSEPGLYVLCDFHPFINDEPINVRLLKDIALNYRNVAKTLVLLSHRLELPDELKRYSARFELNLPSDAELEQIIREEAANWSRAHSGKRVKTDNKTLAALVNNLQGVSHGEARQLVRGVIFDDGAITTEDLPELNKAKFAMLDMESVLSFEYDTAKFSEVGGLENLKAWLKQRQQAFIQGSSDKDEGDDRPKGVLLLGIQGGGKSLAAKAVAGYWSLPLLRLDFGALYNRFFGETERNLREALSMAEQMSPCVLWLDEIEKGIATGDYDSGTSKRLLGTLLTWMAERQQPVFMVATANDISKLPPELMRKGRMDEIFFVDLPDSEVRKQILSIHLRKRNLDPADFNLEELAQISEGFAGAELEQAVVSARYRAAAAEEELTQQHIVVTIKSTRPLSVVMGEEIAALRRWAQGRTVLA